MGGTDEAEAAAGAVGSDRPGRRPPGPPHRHLRRHRGWHIEAAFHELEAAVRGEVDTPGYPRAGLLAFWVAVVAFNVLRVVKAATGAAHGVDAAAAVPGSDVAAEVAGTARGLEAAVGPEVWAAFARVTAAELAGRLREWGRRVRQASFRKQPRGPKKPQPRRSSGAKVKHHSTAKLLAEAECR